MKKIILFICCFLAITEQALVARQVTQNKIAQEKDKKGMLQPRKYEQISIISYAKEPIYVGIFERREDIGQTPRLFGNIYEIEPARSQLQEAKQTVLRPQWDLNLRGLSDNERLLYFSKNRQDLGGDELVDGIEPISDAFLNKANCKEGVSCLNVGQGFFSNRDAFIIYPVNAEGKPDLNGTQLRASDDSSTIRADLEKAK